MILCIQVPCFHWRPFLSNTSAYYLFDCIVSSGRGRHGGGFTFLSPSTQHLSQDRLQWLLAEHMTGYVCKRGETQQQETLSYCNLNSAFLTLSQQRFGDIGPERGLSLLMLLIQLGWTFGGLYSELRFLTSWMFRPLSRWVQFLIWTEAPWDPPNWSCHGCDFRYSIPGFSRSPNFPLPKIHTRLFGSVCWPACVRQVWLADSLSVGNCHSGGSFSWFSWPLMAKKFGLSLVSLSQGLQWWESNVLLTTKSAGRKSLWETLPCHKWLSRASSSWAFPGCPEGQLCSVKGP